MEKLRAIFFAAMIIGLSISMGCKGANQAESDSGRNVKKATGSDTRENKAGNESASKEDANSGKTDTAVSDSETPTIPGKDENEFIPEGWKLEDRVTGDLNGDSLPDSVIQIKKENTAEEDEADRSLIILFHTKDGKYAKAAEAKKIIRCSICGGMLGGGPADIKIKKGVMTISQMYGSRQGADYLHRFRYEKEINKFLMIGEDVKNFDRATGESETTSTNYLTGKQIITKNKVDEKDIDVELSKIEKTVGRSKKYIEDVNYGDY